MVPASAVPEMTAVDPDAVIAHALRSRGIANGPRTYGCYVALGDSFSAGTGCPPGGAWPDRLAAALRRQAPDAAYRNLAQDGARSSDVIDQAAEAVQLEPDLVSVVCGANDALLSVRPDPEAYERNLTTILQRLRAGAPSATIVTSTSPERWTFLELGPRTARRVADGIARINEATRRVALTHDVPCLEVVDNPGLADEENFSEDGLHPSAQGHAQAARCFLELLQGTPAHKGGSPHA